jgi:tetratricopeptide (TPR) repeat protein
MPVIKPIIMQKLIISSIFIFLFVTNVFADELSDGYKSFINNDIKKAYQQFTAASQTPETKPEACLMLSLMSTIDKDQATAFNYFMEFYKNSPNPDPYLLALLHHPIFLGNGSLKSKEQMNWIQKVCERTGINSTLRANLIEDQSKYYETLSDLKKSRDLLAKIGAVSEWQIVGDFENISASGFDKDYGPVNHPEPEAIFKNKINTEVKWFDLYKQVPGKWIDFTNNFNCTNTLVFAQTFCNSSDDQLVHLCIGTSGSLKLWVNDQLLFKEIEERNNGIDTYIIPVNLLKGNNRILIQVACSKIKQCNFLMRVTDKEGNLLPNLSFSNIYKPYNKNVQNIPAPISSYAEEFLLDQINKYPDKLINYLVLAHTYLSNDKVHDAKDILLKAQKMAPNCSYLFYQLYELYIRDQNRTSASLTLEKLKLIDPDNRSVLDFLINDAFDGKNYKDARQLIEKREHLYVEDKDLYYYKLKLASEENKIEEYTALLNKFYTKYPDDYSVVSQKFDFEKDYKKDQKSAVKILKDFSKIYFNKEALNTLSEEYIQSGQARDGIEALKSLIEYLPFNDLYYKRLGLYYLQAVNYSSAKQYLEECLKIAPYYGPYHGNYAKVFEGTGEKEKAIKEYKLDIAYEPDDYEAIKKLRSLQSQKDVFDYFPSKDYYQLYNNSPSAADFPSDNILSLTEEHQVVLYPEGGCESRHVLLIKALTLKGIDLLKEYNVSYASDEGYTIEKAEVIKKNGNRLQAEVNKNKIVYTSLEPGDAVFLIYKKSKDINDQISKLFSDKSLLNAWYPTQNIEYNLLVSKNLKFNYKIDHSDVKPEITDKDDFKLYSWKRTLSKAILAESYMPVMVDMGELLSISSLPDWNYISKWYYDISNTKTKPEIEVIETVNNLLKGKGNLTQLQKARILYNFIEQNIRYSSVAFRQNGIVPQRASEVLITRIGDCKDLAVLFTSMCNVAGIKAEIVLAKRRQNGTNWMGLPSFEFDHAIAKAYLDGKEYYTELTSSFFPFATLNGSLLNAVVLDVNNDMSSNTMPKQLSSVTRQPNNTNREAKAVFTDDNMTCSILTQRTGALAAGTRANYRNLGKEEQENKFVKSITTDYSNVKLLSLNFDSSLNDCSDSLSYNYSFITPKVFTKINDLSIVKLPLTEKVSPMDFLSLEKRKYPIEAWKYSPADTLTEKLIVVFPQNKTLAEIPKSVHYSCNQADYSLTFNIKGNELNVIRKMVYKVDTVPVADYSAYRNFIESVVNSDSQQIAFK